jgi:hypothetical protein
MITVVDIMTFILLVSAKNSNEGAVKLWLEHQAILLYH